jgi:hypothetical protein
VFCKQRIINILFGNSDNGLANLRDHICLGSAGTNNGIHWIKLCLGKLVLNLGNRPMVRAFFMALAKDASGRTAMVLM